MDKLKMHSPNLTEANAARFGDFSPRLSGKHDYFLDVVKMILTLRGGQHGQN